jgi:hypothetical protein
MTSTSLFYPNYFQIWCHRLPRKKIYGRHENASCARYTNDSPSCLFPSQWYNRLFSELLVDTPASCTLTLYVGESLYLRISCSTFLWNRVTSVLKPNILLTQVIPILTCICLSSRLFRMTLGTAPHHTWRHTGAIVLYWNVYRVSRDAFRSFSKRYPSYALRKHICESGLWEG